MAKNSIQDYDVTASLNLDVGGVSIAENCAPANVNDAIRGVMGHLATFCGSVTQAEMDQLKTIGATTISATQWGYLGAFNQALTTTSSPTFNTVTTTNIDGILGANTPAAITGTTGGFSDNVTISGGSISITDSVTTTDVLTVTGNNLTTGSLALFHSNNGSAGHSGNLVEIVNDFFAGGTADLLYLQQDDDGDGVVINMTRSGDALVIQKSGVDKINIDSSGNITQAGTLTCGAITSSSNITGSTANVSVAASTSIVHDTHANRLITSTAAGAVTMTVNSTTGTYQAGDIIVFVQSGAGQITLAAGAGYTMITPANRAATSRVQYSQVTITFISATEFVIGGDLTVV